MSDMGWINYIRIVEDANTHACWETAKRNGHGADEADNCDAGSVGCPDCPFREAAK